MFHRGCDALKRPKHFRSHFLAGRVFWIVNQPGQLFEDQRGALLQAGHLFFPGEFIMGAFQQVGFFLKTVNFNLEFGSLPVKLGWIIILEIYAIALANLPIWF